MSEPSHTHVVFPVPLFLETYACLHDLPTGMAVAVAETMKAIEPCKVMVEGAPVAVFPMAIDVHVSLCEILSHASLRATATVRGAVTRLSTVHLSPDESEKGAQVAGLAGDAA